MKPKIELIALDMDGTTLNADKSLSPGNRQAIEEALAAGIRVVVASGRSFESLPRELLDIPGVDYAITSNGAAIYRVEDGSRCHGWVLEPASVEQILRTVPAELSLEVFVEGIPYGQADFIADPVKFGAPASSVAYVQSTRHPVENIRAFIREHIRELDAIDVTTRGDEERKQVWEALAANVEQVYLTTSSSQLIEISHREAGKKPALAWLADLMGVEASRIAAFGDAVNDIEMLRYAGLGVAMGNAPDEVKAAADEVTRDYREDGVAWAIGKILEGRGEA